MKSRVFARIPKSGLGNCLFVWAHAMVFAREHHLELITGRWSRYRWGAILRKERKNRRYKKYFRETPIVKLFLNSCRLLLSKKIYDPVITREYPLEDSCFVFKKSIQHRDLFRYLRPYTGVIRDELFSLLTPEVQEKFSICEAPEIGIHIRRGDFKLGNPITPNDFFILIINSIRSARGSELPVTVFTDAGQHEIQDILDLPNVSLSHNDEDIMDLLQLSKSRFLILSRSSTFSYWAAFLSNAVVYMDAHDWQEKIKDKDAIYREARIDISKVK